MKKCGVIFVIAVLIANTPAKSQSAPVTDLELAAAYCFGAFKMVFPTAQEASKLLNESCKAVGSKECSAARGAGDWVAKIGDALKRLQIYLFSKGIGQPDRLQMTAGALAAYNRGVEDQTRLLSPSPSYQRCFAACGSAASQETCWSDCRRQTGFAEAYDRIMRCENILKQLPF